MMLNVQSNDINVIYIMTAFLGKLHSPIQQKKMNLIIILHYIIRIIIINDRNGFIQLIV